MAHETIHLSAEGKNAIVNIRRSLQGFDLETDDVQAIDVEIHFVGQDGDDEPEPQIADDSAKENDNKTPDRLRGNTRQHLYCTVLVDLTGTDGAVTSEEVWEGLPDDVDIEKNTVSSALGSVYRKGLLEREKVEAEGSGWEYEYTPTDALRGELVRLGEHPDAS